jgi:urea transporter/murein DD-endopeptidase MepM/ murein hydrolase activator NlpD
VTRFWRLGRTALLSYGVLAFAAHPVPALLILLATFFHPVVGIMGLAGNLVANLVAFWVHAQKESWRAGVYGVSGLLIGLALGMYAEPSLRLWAFLILGAAFTGVLAVMLGNMFARYDLPILSVPFMLVIWLVLLTIGVTEGDASAFPAIPFLQRIDLWLFDALPLGMFEYVKMFGNILFQENLLSGVLVFTAIVLYSRISALYALWGGLVGMVTYLFLHGSLDGFHGLNYVLIALALGGFFIVNNRHAFWYTTLAVVVVGLVDQATGAVLQNITLQTGGELPPLVFAFNLVTLIFLVPLKMVPWNLAVQHLVPVPLYLIRNPESNRRWYRRWSGRRFRQRTLLTLPFIGEWTVWQGNDGEWTHKGTGRYAWDFVVRDERDRLAAGLGLQVEDYYAFGLPVLSPAPGTVVRVENRVEDNPPQRAESERNWGNYVVLDHGNGEFSELSHFRQGSITVVLGQSVQRGEILGYCGNSGRSPVPHIHFQLQTGPEPGSPTLPAGFAEGSQNGVVRLHFVPVQGDRLAPVEMESPVQWSLIGRETEQWIYSVRNGPWRFTETLQFITDDYGLPAVTNGNNSLWHIIELPHFYEIKPDFKTYPTFLSRSAWMKVIGEGLMLPKKLQDGFAWDRGRVRRDDRLWVVTAGDWVLHLEPEMGIVRIEQVGNTKFQAVMVERKQVVTA